MIRGGFYCPACKKLNMCDCETCSNIELNEGELVVITNDDDKETMICAYCGNIFSYDESLETEWEINIVNKDIDKSLVIFKDSLKEKLDIEEYKLAIDNLLVEIEDKCKNEASRQTYLNKLQDVLYFGHRLELMIYFKSSID